MVRRHILLLTRRDKNSFYYTSSTGTQLPLLHLSPSLPVCMPPFREQAAIKDNRDIRGL